MKRRVWGWVGIGAIALLISIWLGQAWQPQGQVAAIVPIAQAPAPVPTVTPAAPILSGTYTDPQGQFEIGILDGYAVSTVAGSPLFQTKDGSLAYSVVRVPLNSEVLLTDIAIVDITQSTLGRGEGFQTKVFTPLSGGGLQIDWVGRFSQGQAPTKPVQGTVLAKQKGAVMYLLVVAALEEASAQIPVTVSTLMNTLNIF